MKTPSTINKRSDNSDSYSHLLNLLENRRDQILQFDSYIKQNTDWLNAPASSREDFHLAYPGGLVKHSVGVTDTLLKLRETIAPELSVESCVLVGLYHDLGKAGLPGDPYYLPNPNQWMAKNRGVNYLINKELVHMDIASRSLFLVSRHIDLTPEEAQAIRYHDGQYIDENKSVAHRECKLTRLLQFADNWTAGVLE